MKFTLEHRGGILVPRCRITRPSTSTRSRQCSRRREVRRRRACADERDRRSPGCPAWSATTSRCWPSSRRPTRSSAEGGLAGHREQSLSSAAGLAEGARVACDEMWAAANVSFALCPGTVNAGRDPRARPTRHRRIEAHLPEKPISGQGRHDVLDRSPRRLRSSSLTTPRRAARRRVPDHRAEDLHHGATTPWPRTSCTGAGAPARRSAGHRASRCSWCRSTR